MLERDDAVNWSTLKKIIVSPKHYREALLGDEDDDTDSKLRGRVLHCAVYEPDKFDERYKIEPRYHHSWKDETAIAKGWEGGRESAARWAESLGPGVEKVTAAVHDAAKGCAFALHADPIASKMIVGGFAEQLIRWTDADTGIECRGRVDHVNGRLSDLKSTSATGWRQIMRAITNYGYHAQLAYYHDGLVANGIALEYDPALIFVEAAPPWDVVVVEFAPEDIAAGRALYKDCLARLKFCRELDKWPGVSGGAIRRVELPAWAMPEEEPLTMGGVAMSF